MSQHLTLVTSQPKEVTQDVWRVLQLNESLDYLHTSLQPAWIDRTTVEPALKKLKKKHECSQSEAILVLRTVAQLGLPDKADYSDICEAGKRQGLFLCSRKVPLGLRRRYWEQPQGHKLFVATQHIFCKGVLHVFVLHGGIDMPSIACVTGSKESPTYVCFNKDDLFCFEASAYQKE